MKIGRPFSGKYIIPDMCEIIEAFAEREEIPILKKCCLEQGWSYDYMMELQRSSPELSQSIKKLLSAKECALEEKALKGEVNVTMAIFSLKQPAHGWKDKVEVKEEIEVVKIVDDLN